MGIDLLMALRIMLLDVLKHRRPAEGRYIPIQLPDPPVQVRIPGADVADVALEVLDVDGIEADDGRVEPHVGLC